MYEYIAYGKLKGIVFAMGVVDDGEGQSTF